MSTNKRIDTNKYSYVYYVATGELYQLDPWQMLGHYPTVASLISFQVKSWKPFKVLRLIDGFFIDNKSGRDVYLGVKSRM